MVSRCFALLTAFLLLQSYDIDFGNFLLSKGPIDVPSLDLIKVYNVILINAKVPANLNVSVTDDYFTIDLGTDCIAVKFKATAKVAFIPITTTYNAKICGAVRYTKVIDNAIADQCHSSKLMGKDDCSLKLSLSSLLTLPLCPFIGNFNMQAKPSDTVHPTLQPGAADVTDYRLIRAIVNIVENIGQIDVFGLKVTTPSPNQLHLHVTTLDDADLNYTYASENLLKLTNYVPASLLGLLDGLGGGIKVTLDKAKEAVKGMKVTNGPIAGSMDLATFIPKGATLDADVFFSGLKCDESGYVCSFPTNGGVQVANLKTTGMADVDTIITNIGPGILTMVNNKVADMLPTLCGDNTSTTCSMPMKNGSPNLTPPMALLIALPIACVILTIIIVIINVRRHRKNPVYSLSTGLPLRPARIVVEDTVFCLFISFTLICFICSNITSASGVQIGKEMTMYAFSLMNTVEDLWRAGLYPLSIFVMVFSGIYPYFKLLCIVLFSVVLQRPDAGLLKVVDVIGKFSLIDTFVMLIFVTGLEIPGVADVLVWPSFYLFLAATVCSILCGNYAVHLWRRGTSVRLPRQKTSKEASTTPSTTPPLPDEVGSRRAGSLRTDDLASRAEEGAQMSQYDRPPCPLNHNYDGVFAFQDQFPATYPQTQSDVGGGRPTPSMTRSAVGQLQPQASLAACPSRYTVGVDPEVYGASAWVALRRRMRRVSWKVSVPAFVLMLGLTLPAWVVPCLEYRVSGVATIIAGPPRRFTLYELASAPDAACCIVAILSILVAPVLFALFFPQVAFLGAWGSADVLLLACVAGLLQLNQFVQFILGGNFDALYSARAVLLWPLIPLLFAAILFWGLLIVELADLSDKIMDCLWKRPEAPPPGEEEGTLRSIETPMPSKSVRNPLASSDSNDTPR